MHETRWRLYCVIMHETRDVNLQCRWYLVRISLLCQGINIVWRFVYVTGLATSDARTLRMSAYLQSRLRPDIAFMQPVLPSHVTSNSQSAIRATNHVTCSSHTLPSYVNHVTSNSQSGGTCVNHVISSSQSAGTLSSVSPSMHQYTNHLARMSSLVPPSPKVGCDSNAT